MIGDAEPDRGGSTGEDVGQRDIGSLRDDQGQPTRPARIGEQCGAGAHDPDRRGLRRRLQEERDALVERPAFHLEQALDATGRGRRDRDPVDRVGRQRDDATGPQDLDRRRPTFHIVGHDAGGHAGTASAAPSATDRASIAVSASRTDAARAADGDARTSASIIRAAPSSASGGAR